MDEVKSMKNAVQKKIEQLQDEIIEMKKNMAEVREMVGHQVGELKIEMKKKIVEVQEKVGGKVVIVLVVLGVLGVLTISYFIGGCALNFRGGHRHM